MTLDYSLFSNAMHYRLYLLLAATLIVAIMPHCTKDDDFYSSPMRNVVSDEAVIPFEELLLLINLKTSDSTYLVVESIDSVRLYVNKNFWGQSNSKVLDTSKVDKTIDGNMFLTGKKINYLITSRQDVEPPNFNTAGDFAAYLNATNDLRPGEYACLIESFQVTFNDGSTQTYHPFEYGIFRVEENQRSAFVGEFQIHIN